MTYFCHASFALQDRVEARHPLKRGREAVSEARGTSQKDRQACTLGDLPGPEDGHLAGARLCGQEGTVSQLFSVFYSLVFAPRV